LDANIFRLFEPQHLKLLSAASLGNVQKNFAVNALSGRTGKLRKHDLYKNMDII
jgi:hypothetical protein